MLLLRQVLISTFIVSTTLFGLVAAWTNQDQEIFRLHDEVKRFEGKNFYSFIGVSPSASLNQINAAYRRMSRKIHPDKAQQVFLDSFEQSNLSQNKESSSSYQKKKSRPSKQELAVFYKSSQERFARLGLVIKILRGPERDRYDHFLRNGFPKWRGTDFYYQRIRPGLGSVLFCSFWFCGGVIHYILLLMGWKRQRDFIQNYISHARKTSYPDSSKPSNTLIPQNDHDTPVDVASDSISEELPAVSNRRQKRLQARQTQKANKKSVAQSRGNDSKSTRDTISPSPGSTSHQGVSYSKKNSSEDAQGYVEKKKRVVAPNGKILLVDKTGDVFLEEEDDEGILHEYLLDVDQILKPTVRDTIAYRSCSWVYRQIAYRFQHGSVNLK